MARVDRAGFGAAPLEVEVENVEQGVATLGRLQNHVDGATDERRDERETARLQAAALVFEEIAGQLNGDLLGLSERKREKNLDVAHRDRALPTAVENHVDPVEEGREPHVSDAVHLGLGRLEKVARRGVEEADRRGRRARQAMRTAAEAVGGRQQAVLEHILRGLLQRAQSAQRVLVGEILARRGRDVREEQHFELVDLAFHGVRREERLAFVDRHGAEQHDNHRAELRGVAERVGDDGGGVQRGVEAHRGVRVAIHALREEHQLPDESDHVENRAAHRQRQLEHFLVELLVLLALDEEKELVATLRGNETALHGTDPVAKQREENGHVRFRVDHIVVALGVSKGEKDVHC